MRNVRNENSEQEDHSLLRSMSGLIDELKTAGNKLLPTEEFKIWKKTFESHGVHIVLKGEFPRNIEKGHLVMGIAREAVTNAVRHGLATEVTIELEIAEEQLRLIITDNGQAKSQISQAQGAILEGGGISGMRERVQLLGGTVTVTGSPCFTLSIEIPKETI
jgi:signal transduction histidine kinase